jgi:hypothetical protein
MPNNTINWEVSIDQANMVLMILGKQPYETVNQLIDFLRDQAGRQIEAIQAQQRVAGAARANGEAHPG